MSAPETIRLASGEPLPYELLEAAGAGGMGTVYRAREQATGRIVALKILRAETGDITRFALEAQVLSRLAHPGIVEYVAHGVTGDGRPWLAMEWLDGETLEAALKRGPMSTSEALRVARRVADALATAHAAGVVHRDLKPSNVFLTRDGRIKLLDFGIAKSTDVTGLTHTGQLVGTPAYMSPEQARGAPIDGRADLFSLGCVLFRCITGRRPFEGADMLAIATKLALEEAPRLGEIEPGVPEDVERLVASLLEKDPAKRPRDAVRVRDALDALARGEELAPSTVPAATRRERPSGRAAAAPDTAMSPVEPTLPSPGPASARRPAGATVGRATVESPPTIPALSRPKASNAPAPPARRAMRLGAVTLGVGIGVIALAAAVIEAPAEHPMNGGEPATLAASATRTPVPSTGGAILGDADRAALSRGCRELSGVLTRGQLTSGGFTSETHLDATGWDTAQQLFAIVEAGRACGAVGAEPVAAASAALLKLRDGPGWRDARANKGRDVTGRGETPGNAWALLALAGAAETLGDASMTKDAIQPRDDLLHAHMPDGGFRYFLVSSTGESATYSTVMATWALMDATSKEVGSAIAPAIAWLDRAVTSDAAMRVPGLEEQATWVLARARRRGLDDVHTLETLRAAARDLVARCELQDDGACARPINDSTRIELTDGAGHLFTLWHPWATLTSYTLASDDSLGFDDDLRTRLAAVARWGIGELRGQMDGLSTADAYKIAEYVVVISEILLAR